MSVFDPESFMDEAIEGSNSTAATPVPPGEYEGVIQDVNPNVIATKDGDRPVLNITWAFEDPVVAEATGRPKSTCRQTIWLDVDDNGKLDMSKGQNVGLGRLREAIDMNDPSKPFRPADMVGCRAMCRVAHDVRNDTTYANVVNVSAI